jgi:hypothetical protein
MESVSNSSDHAKPWPIEDAGKSAGMVVLVVLAVLVVGLVAEVVGLVVGGVGVMVAGRARVVTGPFVANGLGVAGFAG